MVPVLWAFDACRIEIDWELTQPRVGNMRLHFAQDAAL